MQVVIRGLKFIQTFSEILSQRVLSGQLPALFREAWAFSACLSLASVTARSLLPSSLPPARITLQSAASTLGHMSDTPAGDPPHTHHQRWGLAAGRVPPVQSLCVRSEAIPKTGCTALFTVPLSGCGTRRFMPSKCSECAHVPCDASGLGTVLQCS